jgi:nicotinate-nucleotide adenylyltransferase
MISQDKAYPLIGIMGGTFNPIHNGHLRLAQELAEQLTLSQVRFIPSANPPHKATPKVSAQQRAEMVQLAIADNALFALDTRELERLGASYTIDTLISLKTEFTQHALCLIMGSDAFAKLDTWHRWQELINYCHIILVQRPSTTPTGLNQAMQDFMLAHYTEDLHALSETDSGCISMLAIPALDISSSQIRELMALGRNPRYLSPKAVVDYMQLNSLYLE